MSGMKNTDAAVELFAQGYNCAQSVFAAFGPKFGLERSECLIIASALGGGIGRQGDTCGAVAGALMILGLECGNVVAEDPAAKAQAYARGQEFIDAFKERNSTIICRELLGLDMSDPDTFKTASEAGLITTVCTRAVRDAGEILEIMLGSSDTE
jgi:C_GCAxxG_C_C family probable redox protein